MPSLATAPSSSRHHAIPPQREAPGERSWITRGANFVVVVSQVTPGTVLERVAQTDESMILLADLSARIETTANTLDAGPESLIVAPPGRCTITAASAGTVVRVFSSLATDLLAMADNAAVYAAGAPEVAPLVPWPAPADGLRLRHYRLSDYTRPGVHMRIFRCTNLMVNVMMPRPVARDITKLSPHQHADFEQGSLALRGTWMHHLRHPWTPDLNDWKPDEHIRMESPSLLVIPPKVIHTSHNLNDGGAWLIDIFAPPRVDFSATPGKVANENDYPLPPGVVAGSGAPE